MHLKFWKNGEPFVWLTGAALTAVLLITLTLLVVVAVNGLGVFWPHPLVQLELEDGSQALGRVTKTQEIPVTHALRSQYKVGNRDLYGMDFRWIDHADILSRERPEDAYVVERVEYGDFFGYVREIRAPDVELDAEALLHERFAEAVERVHERYEAVEELDARIAGMSNEMEAQRLKSLKWRENDPERHARWQREREREEERFQRLVDELSDLRAEIRRNTVLMADQQGREQTISIPDIVRIHRPNAMGFWDKVGYYAQRVRELLLDDPRESNTEGGLFPAIFGTVMMVIIMSVFAFPLGVVAGIYLREYAKEGLMVRLVRIAVNNLAGIPSIVYGIFGLGFFVYGVGATIDQLFYSERLPDPTFGTGGILWASLTLALLTVPVVIVATEEALGAIPMGIREGSLALGATKFQTLVRVLLPMASPGIMTGFILAMARAAGEVAPLMITGVVKLAPALALDGTPPFLHLDRKFMHLGFHIYDIGFQSPNVEAAKPMVYVTTLLLLLVVLVMNSVAIYLRNQMKKRYSMRAL